MARFGQSTSRAALIYQHAAQDRDHEIADALDGMIDAKLKRRPAGGRRRSLEVDAAHTWV
jgi:hypothetical protein